MSELPLAILAGGLGTRLRSVVSDRPKVLAEVAGKPFLMHLLDQAWQAGIRKVIICSGYLQEQIVACCGTHYQDIEILYSAETQPLGTAGALRLALPKIAAQHFLVMNGDSYCAANLEEFVAWHFARGSRASLLLRHVDDTSRYGRVLVADDGRIEGFLEKSETKQAGWINAGVYLIDQDLIQSLPADVSISLETDCFSKWAGRTLTGFPVEDGIFIDIGTPESYVQAEELFAVERHI